ncbi:unnamed protein product [Bursaphelenchus xylophilus]|nr:unnamed protein product [Bursaphelenchus xylophilus]CAG9080354.1 unnamed protein product [Bursaphelenchus xylophilus]
MMKIVVFFAVLAGFVAAQNSTSHPFYTAEEDRLKVSGSPPPVLPNNGSDKGSHFFRRRILERDLVGFKREASAIIERISKSVYDASRPRKSTAKFSRNERMASSKETAYFICSGGRVVIALAFCARRGGFDPLRSLFSFLVRKY